MNHPKKDQAIQDQIQKALIQDAQPGYGIVLAHHADDNTVDVLMSQPNSDSPGQMFTRVPYPTTIGVQSVAPDAGRPCWVVFKDGTQSNPMVTHFFNHLYNQYDYDKQYRSANNVPRFMTEL